MIPPDVHQGQTQSPGAHPGESALIGLLHRALSPDEEERLLGHLAACPPCEERFKARFVELQSLQATWEIQNSADGSPALRRRRPMGPSAASRENPRRKLWEVISSIPWRRWIGNRVLLPIPVVLGAAAFLLFRTLGSRSPEMTLRPLPLTSALGLLRGPQMDSTLAQGIRAYEEDALAPAVKALTVARTADEQHEILRQVYLGSALARLGRYDEALGWLAKTPSRSLLLQENDFGRQAVWTRTICLLRLGRTREAVPLLRELVPEPGEIGRQARLWLSANDRPPR